MAPKCDICFHKFDLELHRPKCLSCGHTICKECVLNPALERKCPTCRKVLTTDPVDLPDNIFVIQMIEDEDEDEDAPLRKKIKTEDTKAQPLVRAVDAGRVVVQKLQQVVPTAVEALNRLLESSTAQLRQMEEALEELEREAVSEVAQEHLQLGAQLEDSARLLATSRCSVVAEEEGEEGGDIWKASVQLEPVEHILYPLLLQLRANGQLKKVDDFAETLSPTTYVGPPGISVLKIKAKSDVDEDGALKVNDILQDERRWKNVRCLKNVRGVGAEKLLRVVAPQLEELESQDAVEPEFMREVEKMKALKRLVVKCDEDLDDYPDLPMQLEELSVDHIKERQLRCVLRMARLRSLTVTNYFGPDMWFPPQQGRLLWLRLGLNAEKETTMLSLIGAYCPTLQELQIVCGVSEDHVEGFYFPDLAQDLAACDLPCLRRFVLVRRSTRTPCPEVDACLLQRRAIREALSNSVDVICNACPLSMV